MSDINFELAEPTIEDIEVDPEFRAICRNQTPAEHDLFRKSVLKEGFQDRIKVWNSSAGDFGQWLILDGHHRYELWDSVFRDEPDRTPEIEIITSVPEGDRKAAIRWIIRHQLGKRNLTSYERIELAKLLEPAIREQAKQNQSEAGGPEPGSASGKNAESAPVDTRKEVAKAANVSEGTVKNYDTVMNSGEEDLKEQVRKQEKSIGGAAKEVKRRQAVMQQPEPSGNAFRWSQGEIELRRRMESGKVIAVDADEFPNLAKFCRDKKKAVILSQKKLKGKAILYTDLNPAAVNQLAEAANQ